VFHTRCHRSSNTSFLAEFLFDFSVVFVLPKSVYEFAAITSLFFRAY
jgi:hypothetical protein